MVTSSRLENYLLSVTFPFAMSTARPSGWKVVVRELLILPAPQSSGFIEASERAINEKKIY
jgi:hypothetical protein